MKTLLIILLTLSYNMTMAQYCEEFDRKLFPLLPDDFPEKINCRDTLERKQGWWLNFKIQHNPVDKFNKLVKGNYVDNYIYGMYKDDTKVGEWVTVSNVHKVYIKRKDKYYYAKDTFLISSGFAEGGWNESSIYCNSDSSIIKSTSLVSNDIFPICIECNKNGLNDKECIMTYRDKKIKEFPFDQFDFEFFGSFSAFTQEKYLIDEVIKKQRSK